MKKIVIVDGGPRKTFNTAAMLQKIADGIASAGGDIVVQRVRLYMALNTSAVGLAGRQNLPPKTGE